MRDRPDGAQLRDLARETSLRFADRLENAALISRALEIAARELHYGDALVAACRAALCALYGDGDLDDLFRRLAAEIRSGAYDAPGMAREQVRRLLWAVTVQKLREGNPAFLEESGLNI